MVIGSNNTSEAGVTSSFCIRRYQYRETSKLFAFGQGNTSDGENSFVADAKAVGRDTFAFGSSAEALTEYTIAIGSQAVELLLQYSSYWYGASIHPLLLLVN